MTLRFGKYKGRSLDGVPLGYLQWLAQQRWLYPTLATAVRGELRRRASQRDAPRGAVRLLPSPEIADAARRIIHGGFRSIAKQTHPDHGGGHNEQVALGAARDFLTAAVERGVAA